MAAVEQVLGVVVETVVTQAFSLARERISGAWGVEKNLQSLGEQFEIIEALLSDAETKSTTSRAVEVWLKKLENAATDASFLLDEFGSYVLSKQIEKSRNLAKVCRFFSTSSNPIVFRFKMASKIKDINLRFDGIFKESERIGLVKNMETMNSSSSIDIRKDRITDPFVVNSEVVGRNDVAEEIVRNLTSKFEDENDLSIIGIVGMAGQGKTTLAQLVYNVDEVTGYFDKKIWVCVSDDFNVEKILNDMLQFITGRVSTRTIRQAIVEQLKKELKEKRFLLVLDEVWNEDPEKWSCMKRCLQEIHDLKGSKIIVTTRSMQVISIMRPFFVHKLGALSENDSWKLFEKIAFADDEAAKIDKELVSIGKTIVKRCGGLPLAIKAIGGLMYSNRNANEWSKIAESDICNSLDPQTNIMPVVKLSYDHLPSLSLKQCLAYCAIFRKDSIIKREELIQQWMAHGLLNPSQGSKLSMEDVGNNYFETLLKRSLFQDVKFDKFGNIESCKMHDIVHDFVLNASKDRCLIIEDGVESEEDIKALHLSISANRGEYPYAMVNKIPFRLRTLFILLDKRSCPLGQLAKCKYLCVLILSVWVEKLPSSIAKMKCLRYLDISHTLLESLPNSITKLYNLQTLRLNTLLELPKDFGSLVKLRHLYIRSTLEKTSLPGISRLTCLRTLSYFVVSRDERCQIKELKYLHSLEGDLKLYDLENVRNLEEAMEADLSSKRYIVNLELNWGDENIEENGKHEDVMDGLKPHGNLKGLTIFRFAGKNLPSWIQFLDNLVSISLWGLTGCEKIPILGKLPCLKVVDIGLMESVKCIGNEFYGWENHQTAPNSTSSSVVVSFPSLRNLRFENMPNLEQWSDPSEDESIHEVFPVLETLSIGLASKLTRLPNVLNKTSSLKDLGLINLDNLSHLPKGLLLSLEKFWISRCHSLVSTLSMQSLKSMRKLIISRCNKLGIFENRLDLCEKLEDLEIIQSSSIRIEVLCCPTNLRRLTLELPQDINHEEDKGFPWPVSTSRGNCNASFPFLEILNLKGNSKTNSLPEQIQHLPALRMLRVDEFGGIETLPEWLCNITSLRSLVIGFCKNLAYLPSRDALQRLTTTCELAFVSCLLLSERSKEGSGPEWNKIAHLQNISFYFH